MSVNNWTSELKLNLYIYNERQETKYLAENSNEFKSEQERKNATDFIMKQVLYTLEVKYANKFDTTESVRITQGDTSEIEPIFEQEISKKTIKKLSVNE